MVTGTTDFANDCGRKIRNSAVRIGKTSALAAELLFYDTLAPPKLTRQFLLGYSRKNGMFHSMGTDLEAICLQGNDLVPSEKRVDFFYGLVHRMPSEINKISCKLFVRKLFRALPEVISKGQSLPEFRWHYFL